MRKNTRQLLQPFANLENSAILQVKMWVEGNEEKKREDYLVLLCDFSYMLLERLQKLVFVFCRYSCGNNVHIKGMKIWADHQDELENDSVVKCSLCREKFAPLRLILEFRNSK